MDKRVERIWKFYKAVNPLKRKTRTGWESWGITPPSNDDDHDPSREVRGESGGEHSNSAQWLAFAVFSEYPDKYPNVNIFRVSTMLGFHELDEATIPDFTPFSGITKEEKKAMSKVAVEKTASILTQGKFLIDLIQEFEDGETIDGRFAKMVDSLDAGFQCKIFEEQGLIDLSNPKAQEMLKKHDVHARGHDRLSDSWLAYCVEAYNYDDVFKGIANQLQQTRSEQILKLHSVLNKVSTKKLIE